MTQTFFPEHLSPEVLGAALHAHPVAMTWAKLEDQSLLYVNAAFIHIFGYPPGEFPSIAAWVEATYPFAEDRALAWERWGTSLSSPTQRTIEPMEIRILCANGAIKNILHSGVVLPGSGGFYATFVDLSTARRDRPSPMVNLEAARQVDAASHLFAESEPPSVHDTQASNPWETLVAERARQAEALRISAELLDRTGSLAGVGGWEVDLVHNTVSWTAETHRIHAVPPGFQPTLHNSLAFYESKSRHLIRNALEDAIGSGLAYDVEAPVIRADGQKIWVRTKGSVEFLDGRAIRIIGALQDVTARVAEQNALKQANERLVLATQSGQIGIYDWDMVNDVSVWDDRTFRLSGLDPAIDKPSFATWIASLHPDDRERAQNTVIEAIKSGLPHQSEYRVIWPDGSIHHLRWNGQATLNEEGVPIRFNGVNWDVTEQRRLAIERADQDELFRITLESIGDGVITTGADTHVRWMNQVAERLTGWSSAEATGRPVADIFKLVHEETRQPVPDPLAACLARGQATNLPTCTLLISRDGREIGIDDSAAPIRDAEGKILGVVLVFHDVTEQRRLSREARRRLQIDLQMKDEFLSHVSHELRSPLAAIYSFANIIADGLGGETTPEQKEYLEIILRNSRQLRSMIEDLLQVTRSETGKLSIVLEATSVAEAVTDALNTVQGAATAKGITLSSTLPPDLPCATADPTRIRQVLIIILDNAAKFTPSGGTIHVSVAATGDLLQLTIADSGCGIDPDSAQRIFEHLYQVDEPGREGRNGLGLGLYIARDLVVRQGGTIWVESEIGKGSQFHFTLPIVQPSQPVNHWGAERRRTPCNA